MVAKSYILKELDKLKKIYDNAMLESDKDLPKYYSKLALLELCGWIEESMDDLILKYSHRKRVKDLSYINTFVSRNYSFDYSNNFREMLIKLIGIVYTEKIENRITTTIKSKFEASLSSLRTMRDIHAHTNLQGQGSTKILWTPSITIGKFIDVYAGLKSYENELKTI